MKKKKTNPEWEISKAHDRFFKKMMSDKQTAREFFSANLPEEIRQNINLDDLEIQTGSFVDDLRKETIADMAFKTTFLNSDAYIHLIVDHQSTPDELMPFRILRYTCNIIDQHLTDFDTNRIPFVIPLVVYHGIKPWKYSTNINDLVDAPKELVDKYFLKPFLLMDLNTIDDEVLREHTHAGVMLMTLKYIFYRDILAHLPKIFSLLKTLAPFVNGNRIIEIVLIYVLDRGEVGDKETYFDMVKKEFTPELGEKVMTISEQLRAEGFQHGLEKGIEQGIERGVVQGMEKKKTEMVKEMLAENLPVQLISKISKLSINQIEEILSKMLTSSTVG